jgi:excinuclease ABC subunit C
LSLPDEPGVYQFLDGNGAILYVGKAKSLKSRVSSYFTDASQLGQKTRVLVSQIEKIKITIVESELESLLLEAFYIKKFKPKYNVRLADNKSYPLIKITIQDTYPAVLFVRRADDPKAAYFGPYPQSGAVKQVLKFLRRAFPYQTTTTHPKRVCLYNHLNLCPCPPVFDSPHLRKSYKQHIKNIMRVLEGESRNLIKELEKKRDEYSKAEQFEDAGKMQQQISSLSFITQPFHRPLEYDSNPNLREDIRAEESHALRDALEKAGLSVASLQRIECYDISNIQGEHATASMVVFINGEKASAHYRKFKIRISGKPNDFAMMQEVLERRLKHAEWEYPGLIIIDGGKGQVSASMAVLQAQNRAIPLIGLAKRVETIVIPKIDQTTGQMGFTEVVLGRSHKAILLITRIRDEAHRFAVTYHRKLRSKAMTA